MKIDLFGIKEKLNVEGEDLLTRPLGSDFYNHLVDSLRSASNEAILELDFSGIKTIDFSFADECIARLFEEEMRKDRYDNCVCLIKDLKSKWAIENLHVALDYDRDVCCFVLNELSNRDSVGEKFENRTAIVNSRYFYVLIGSLEDKLYETLEYVINQRSTTARAIADSFNLNINTASTRLLKLYQKHLIHRKEEVSSEGRQFIYRSPF